MSDSDDGPIARRRSVNKTSIASDSEEAPIPKASPSKTRRSARVASQTNEIVLSSSESEGDSTPPIRKTTRKNPVKCRNSAPTDRMSSTAKGFIQAPYESARDRFLQENDDSSLDNFIADDDSESASSSAESDGANDNTRAVDNSDSDDHTASSSDSDLEKRTSKSTQLKRQPALSASKRKQAAGSGSNEDDEVITPKCSSKKKKKTPQNRIHSSDSEDGNAKNQSKSMGNLGGEAQKVRKRKKKVRRRVVVEPESQEQATNVNEEGDSGSEERGVSSSNESISDFVVADSDSVSGEDDADPMFYPEESYKTSSHQNMDRQQAFKVVVEAMLNRVRDENFFQTNAFIKNEGLRQAFRKVFSDIDTILNDLRSQAWSKSFVSALGYTELMSTNFRGDGILGCEVCPWKQRYASYKMSFSGYKYNAESLKPATDDDDDQQMEFSVGRYCEERGQLYHEVFHFKRNLLNSCVRQVKKKRLEDESIEDMVTKLVCDDNRWIETEYKLYETLLKSSQKLIQSRSGYTNDGPS